MTSTSSPEAVLEQFRAAWDAGDADAYSRLFTEDATYVIYLGDALLGRDQIAETHQDVFTKWQKGTKLIVEPVSTTMIDEDTAVILTVGGIGTKKLQYDKFQTFVVVRQDGEWRIAAFQNTEMSGRAKKQYAR